MPDGGRIYSKYKDEVIIIDEIDYVMLDRKAIFYRDHNAICKVVGLTATTGKQMLELERDYLAQVQQFSIYDSGIEPAASAAVKPQYLEYKDFFASVYDNMGRLVYCEEAEFDSIKASVIPARLHHATYCNVEDLAQLADIQPGSVYLISEQCLMRGFDYRCKNGLALLISKRLDSERALYQALARVGRYDEDICHRFVLPSLKSLEPIDQSKRQLLVKNVT